ncbi:MAG: glutamate racemase [Alphaproteobacteria bacterium]|nr:glutamate racemase [Alphaproteobacteria bacterium]
MNIGTFDSGLGGLLITKSLIEAMPEYNFCYLGDTLHVPYGARSKEVVYTFTKNCIEYLFEKKDCKLIIIACNTATFAALRKLQQTYLPQKYPDRRILGVIVPTVEEVIGKKYNSVGLLATQGTVNSDVYGIELKKRNPDIKLYSHSAPLLVPLVENNADEFAMPIIESYVKQFANTDIEAIILGCTHYPHYKTQIATATEKILGRKIDIISQDEFLSVSLKNYLLRHPEIDKDLSKDSKYVFEITDINDAYISQAKAIFGNDNIVVQKVDI